MRTNSILYRRQPGGLEVTRTSDFTGHRHSLVLPITEEQLHEWIAFNRNIQDVMPHLSPDQREFLLSGATKEEWDALFAEDLGPEGEDDGEPY